MSEFEGLNFIEWARWKKNLLNTGSYDPNEWHKLNREQAWWTKETMNALKSINNNYETLC